MPAVTAVCRGVRSRTRRRQPQVGGRQRSSGPSDSLLVGHRGSLADKPVEAGLAELSTGFFAHLGVSVGVRPLRRPEVERGKWILFGESDTDGREIVCLAGVEQFD